jgi:hypothetical protein
MHVLTAIKQNPLFRAVWWMLCLPLEILTLAMLPVRVFCRIIPNRPVARCWALAMLILYAMGILTDEEALRFGLLGVILVGICMFFIPGVCKYIAKPPSYFWRLGTRNPLTQRRKEILAEVSVKSQANSRETRQKMTARLSPRLQMMLVKVG